MKIKYLILRANRCNGYWSYYGPPKKYENRVTPITDEHGDRFLNVDVVDAVQYNSEKEAEQAIKSFEEIREIKTSFNEKVEKLHGAGIYKIEKIYILEN